MDHLVRTNFIKQDHFTKGKNLAFEKAHERLKLLGKNQLNIYGFKFEENKDEIIAKAIIRSTVEKPIRFKEKINIALFDNQRRFITKQAFDFNRIQPLEPNSAYPYIFHFIKKDFLKKDYTLNNNWIITFERKRERNKLDLSESPLSEKSREQLEKILDKVGPPKEDEVNIIGLSIKKIQTGEIQTTVLIRNGSKKPVDIKTLPMQIVTPSGEVVAKGTFSLEGLIVKPYTSKPASFVFPKKAIKLNKIDLTTCKIQAIT